MSALRETPWQCDKDCENLHPPLLPLTEFNDDYKNLHPQIGFNCSCAVLLSRSSHKVCELFAHEIMKIYPGVLRMRMQRREDCAQKVILTFHLKSFYLKNENEKF